MALKSPEGFFLGLLLLGTGGLLLWLGNRAGRRRLLSAMDSAFLPKPKPLPLPFLLAPLLLILAAGRPEATLPWRENLTRAVLVVDTSHSMAADDETPSRLERAKALAENFLRGLDPSVKVGLVSFGPQAVLVLSPTLDRQALLEALEDLKPTGTSPLGQGLLQAKRVLRPEEPERDLPKPRAPAALLLLSDGVANAGTDPLEAAGELSRAGLPVFVRPLGDPRGAVSRIGEGLYFVPANPLSLLRLAQATGGKVLGNDFKALYQALRPHHAWKTQRLDLTQALVVAGFLLLSFGTYLNLGWEGKWP